MGRGSLMLLAILAVLFVAAPATFCQTSAQDSGGDPPAEPDDATMYGFVANISDEEENTPLQDVRVTLYDEAGEELADPVTTDSEGRFGFTVQHTPGDVYRLSFDYSGYAIRALPNSDMSLEDGMVSFTLDNIARDADGAYPLSGDAYGPNAFAMAVTTGTIYGVVTGDDGQSTFPLEGAVVTVVSDNGMSYESTANEWGYFQIECPYGSYSLTVRCNGFQGSEPMNVETSRDQAYRVTLQQNTSEVFMGLDSAHTMMLIGIALTLALVLVTALLHLRSKKPESEVVLMNDLPELERKDEEDVRRP